jgi:enolase
MPPSPLACRPVGAAAAGEPLWRHLAAGAPVTLPLPEIQIFGGGAHAGRRVDVQDFMVMPVSATSFARALEMTAEVYRAAGELMHAADKLAGVADEGGWWPSFDANEEALEWLVRAIERAGIDPGGEVAISLDVVASELGRDGRYRLGLEGRELDSTQDRDAARLGRAIPSCRSRIRSPKMTARAWRASRKRWPAACR